MPEVPTMVPTPAIGPEHHGIGGGAGDRVGIHVLEATSVAMALTARGAEHDSATRLHDCAAGGDISIRAAGPGKWYAVSRELDADALMNRLAACGGSASLLDQSSGRVALRLVGRNAAGALSKGTALDLHAKAFPVGASAVTLVGHIGVHIMRTGDETFELLVMRSYAESLLSSLKEMCGEFGYEVFAG